MNAKVLLNYAYSDGPVRQSEVRFCLSSSTFTGLSFVLVDEAQERFCSRLLRCPSSLPRLQIELHFINNLVQPASPFNKQVALTGPTASRRMSSNKEPIGRDRRSSQIRPGRNSESLSEPTIDQRHILTYSDSAYFQKISLFPA